MNLKERMIIAVNLEKARGTTEGKILQMLYVSPKFSTEWVKNEERKKQVVSSQKERLMYYVFCRGEMIPLTLDIESLLIVRPS